MSFRIIVFVPHLVGIFIRLCVCVFFCLLVFVQFKATLVEVWTLGNVGKVPKVFGGNLGAPTCAGGALGLSGHRT